MSAFESDISALSITVEKKVQSEYMSRRTCGLPGSAAAKRDSALPSPYQPGSTIRLCIQEKTHGMARKSATPAAARRYLDELASRSLTQQVNDALQAAGDDDSAAVAVQAGRDLLAAGADW